MAAGDDEGLVEVPDKRVFTDLIEDAGPVHGDQRLRAQLGEEHERARRRLRRTNWRSAWIPVESIAVTSRIRRISTRGVCAIEPIVSRNFSAAPKKKGPFDLIHLDARRCPPVAWSGVPAAGPRNSEEERDQQQRDRVDDAGDRRVGAVPDVGRGPRDRSGRRHAAEDRGHEDRERARGHRDCRGTRSPRRLT